MDATQNSEEKKSNKMVSNKECGLIEVVEQKQFFFIDKKSLHLFIHLAYQKHVKIYSVILKEGILSSLQEIVDAINNKIITPTYEYDIVKEFKFDNAVNLEENNIIKEKINYTKEIKQMLLKGHDLSVASLKKHFGKNVSKTIVSECLKTAIDELTDAGYELEMED